MSNEVEKLEQHLSELKKQDEFLNKLERLQKNPDFKELILDEFCVQEAARYVANSVDLALPAEARADSLRFGQACGLLRQWMAVRVQMGMVARANIVPTQEAIDEARLENKDEVEG